MNTNVGTREAFDLAVAWVALGVAFTVFLRREVATALFAGLAGGVPEGLFATAGRAFALSMVTVGVGFLLHELAHKVVAIRFGQRAQFRADYGMLLLAIAGAFAGFLFGRTRRGLPPGTDHRPAERPHRTRRPAY